MRFKNATMYYAFSELLKPRFVREIIQVLPIL